MQLNLYILDSLHRLNGSESEGSKVSRIFEGRGITINNPGGTIDIFQSKNRVLHFRVRTTHDMTNAYLSISAMSLALVKQMLQT
jgi:hypothetical protein